MDGVGAIRVETESSQQLRPISLLQMLVVGLTLQAWEPECSPQNPCENGGQLDMVACPVIPLPCRWRQARSWGTLVGSLAWATSSAPRERHSLRKRGEWQLGKSTLTLMWEVTKIFNKDNFLCSGRNRPVGVVYGEDFPLQWEKPPLWVESSVRIFDLNEMF